MPSPYPTLCIGCGKDHAPGRGCGYAREVRWTPYSTRERFTNVRVFPVLAGAVAAGVAVFFVVRPPDNPIFLYVGVALPALIALVVGGLGTKAMVGELRKRRHRGRSSDGRDRALVVMVGGELRYAFGESLKYESVSAPDYARDLSSRAAAVLGDELPDLLDRELAAWLRRDAKDETLLRDPSGPEALLACTIAMTVLGLLGRGRIALFVGSYRAWGRGGGKMKKTTPGFELALDSVSTEVTAGEARLERQLLSLAEPGETSPIALDAILDAIAAGRDAEAMMRDLQTSREDTGDEIEIDRDAARESWRLIQKDEAELVMRLLEHALPERPRTICAENDGRSETVNGR